MLDVCGYEERSKVLGSLSTFKLMQKMRKMHFSMHDRVDLMCRRAPSSRYLDALSWLVCAQLALRAMLRCCLSVSLSHSHLASSFDGIGLIG